MFPAVTRETSIAAMDSTTKYRLNKHSRFNKRLGVLGQAPHWIGPDGAVWAYEPYVREMRIWADLFSHIQVCSPLGEGSMRGNLAPYARENIEFVPVRYSLSYGYSGALKRLFQLPGLVRSAYSTIVRNDFVHLRSPAHFGLVGAALVRWMKRSSITKWAGENGAYEGERLPTRLNRYIESVPNDLHPVLVYGSSKRSHHISFLPALMSTQELVRAREMSSERRWSPPWKILSVGRLIRGKGFDLAIRGLGELNRIAPQLPWEFVLIGDGSAAEELKELANQCSVADRVTFAGALPFEQVQKHYAAAHVVIMPSTKEGWPKVIAEAWAHGAVPLAAPAALVPWILQDEQAGVIFEATPSALAAALSRLLSSPERMRIMSQGLFHYAREMSLEHFKNRLEQVLVERCGLQ